MPAGRSMLRWLPFPPRRPVRRGRRWWRLFRRGVLLPAVLLVVAYLSLPWWLPTDWLRGQIIAQLQRDLGRPVSIAGLEVSWRDGIVLRDLRIYQADAFGPGDLLRVPQVSMPLSPIRMAFAHRIGRVQVDDAELFVVRNEAGVLNLSELKPAGQSMWIDELCCRGTTVTLTNRRSRYSARIPLDTLDCQFVPAIRVAVRGRGEYQLAGRRREEIGRFTMSAHALDPQSGASDGGGPRQGGQLHVSWRTVNLESLPLNDWPELRRLGLTEWGGRCSGQLDVELTAEGRLAWRVTAQLAEVDVHLGRLPRGVQVPSARLELSGQYDLASLGLAIDRLAVELPGLSMAARLQVRPDDAGYVGLAVERARVDLVQLRHSAPDLLDWIDRAPNLAGTLDVHGKIDWSESARAIALTLDGTNLAVSADWLTKPAGTPAIVTVDGRYQQDIDRLDVRAVAFQLAGSTLALTSSSDELFNIFAGRKKVWDVWLGWSGLLTVRTADAAELLGHVPALRRGMGDARIAGPAEFVLQFRPIDRAVPLGQPRQIESRQLRAQLDLPAATTLRLFSPAPDGTLAFDKPAGEPVTLLLEGTFEPDAPTVRTGRLLIRRGPATGRSDTPAILAIDPFHGRLAFAYPPESAGQPDARPDMNIDFAGRLVGRRLEHLLDLSPCLRAVLAERHVRLAGGLGGDVLFRLGPGQLRTRLAVDLSDADLAVDPTDDLLARLDVPAAARSPAPPVFTKPPGDRAAVVWDYRAFLPPALGARDPYREERLELAGLGLSLSAERIVDGDRPEHRSAHLTLASAETALDHCPLLARQVRSAGVKLGGAVTARIAWQAGAEHAFALDLDAAGLDVRAVDAARWPDAKPAGVPLTLSAHWTTNLPDEPNSPRIDVQRAHLALARSEFDLSGTLSLLPVWWSEGPPLRGETLGSILRRPVPIDRMDLAVHGRVAIDADVRRSLTAVDRLASEWNLAGGADISARVTGGWRELNVQALVDAAGLAIGRGGALDKPAGLPASAELDVACSPWLEILHIRRAAGRLGKMNFALSGQVHRQPGTVRPRNYDLTLSADVPDLDQIARVCPAITTRPDLLAGPLSGRVAGEIHLLADDRPGGDATVARPLLLPSRLELDNARLTFAGTPIAATGRVELSRRALFSPGLSVQVGGTKVALVAHVNDPMGQPRGWLNIVGERLDVDQLSDLWQRLGAVQLSSQPHPQPGPPGSSHASGAAATQPGSDEAGAARTIIDLLARCDIAGKVHFADLIVSDPKNQTRYKLAEFRSAFSIDAGQVRFPFQTAMEGGLLAGRVSGNLADATPMLAIEYDAHRLFPTKNVQPIVEAFFPGITLYGHVTMRESNQQKLLPRPGEPNWTTGKGEIIFEDGMLVGQAGPDWMAKIFPGLKLTQYRFKQMHNWFTLTDDGRANHHMIFEGQSYDVYMIGYTHRGTGQARYTVGVDLLASMDSKTWSVDLRQGKIPLMYVSGRIENRTLKDASFTMVPPPVALFQMLIRDNILYRGVIERALRRGKSAE